MDIRAKERAAAKNEKQKQLRLKARESGKPDLRTKEHRPKPNRVPKTPTIMKINPVRMQSKALPPLAPKRKPKAQSAICRIPLTPASHTKTWIPELKMDVYIKPGQTVEKVIAKYSQRPGNKIAKW